MAQQSQLTDAGRTFRENEILLTGGNGFLGKVILAMLLERYPQVKHIHVLLRPGRGLSAEERFNAEVMDSPVMAALLATRGEKFVRERISVWPVELSQPDCGRNEQALKVIAARVKLIINCAGKVEFFPPVDESLQANVDGVENAIAMVAPGGHLSVVLQLPSESGQKAVTSHFPSIESLGLHFSMISPEWLFDSLAGRGFRLNHQTTRALPAGKSFWAGIFSAPETR